MFKKQIHANIIYTGNYDPVYSIYLIKLNQEILKKKWHLTNTRQKTTQQLVWDRNSTKECGHCKKSPFEIFQSAIPSQFQEKKYAEELKIYVNKQL